MAMLFGEDARRINEVLLDDISGVTLAEFVAICRFSAKVHFSPDYEQRVRKSRAALERKLSDEKLIYGVNTGFGDNVRFAVKHEDLVRLQENILRSHACSVGDALPYEQVRGLLLMLLVSIGHGYSAVRFDILELVRDFLNHGITPYVPYEGSLGTLSFAPYASLTLIGEGRVIDSNGKIIPTRDLLHRHGLQPIQIQPREGLGIVTNMAAHVGPALLAMYDLVEVLRYSDICAALVCEALQSTDKAFDPRLLELKKQKEHMEMAAWMRSILSGSEIMLHARNQKVQDCSSIRIIPHLYGAVKQMTANAYYTIMNEFHSVLDNPVFFTDGTALMGSNWDKSYITLHCESLSIAVTELAKAVNAHMRRLVDTKLSGLPPFLVKDPGVNNGFMIVQYVTEGLMSEIAHLANPITNFYTSVSAGQEEPHPMGDSAARKLLKIIEKYRNLVTLTMMTALQALDFIDKSPSHTLAKVHKKVRETVSFMATDDTMYERIEAMQEIVESGDLLQLVHCEIGDWTI